MNLNGVGVVLELGLLLLARPHGRQRRPRPLGPRGVPRVLLPPHEQLVAAALLLLVLGSVPLGKKVP